MPGEGGGVTERKRGEGGYAPKVRKERRFPDREKKRSDKRRKEKKDLERSAKCKVRLVETPL